MENDCIQSLFGDEFNINLNKPKVKNLVKKIKAAEDDEEESDVAKVLKSKKVSLKEKLELITTKVLSVLGKQRENVIVIKTKEQLADYISAAITSGRIAIDTETNNSLDPVTCKLMGPCLYYPGGKSAYVPMHHVNPDTKEPLAWQLTEKDFNEQIARCLAGDWTPDFEEQSYLDWYIKHVIQNKEAAPRPLIIMHNGKFDYEVIKCTCDIAIAPDWDTIIAARLLDENEEAGLKAQYRKYIDPTQEKYDIEELFRGVPYSVVDPDIFALYAATDSLMTDKLFIERQLTLMLDSYEEAHTVHPRGLFWVFNSIEMPIVVVTAEMELAGVCVDMEFGERLKVKYTNQLQSIDDDIQKELDKLKPVINKWRLDPKSNERTKQFQPKKTKLTLAAIEEKYPLIDDKTKKRFKWGKAQAEQLADPINLASPVQLAILFYDILKCPSTSKKSPRGTGEEELKSIAENNPELTICKKILDRRGIVKLISTYIDVIPTLTKHWPDGRIRFHLNSLGTDTGRYSSGGKLKFMELNPETNEEEPVEVGGINIQNIPSHNKEIRMLFKAKESAKLIEAEEDEPFIIPEISEVETTSGWKYCSDLVEGDKILVDGIPTTYHGRKYLADNKEWAILAYD